MRRHAEIAGAGLAGLTAAAALCRRGWTVRVQEVFSGRSVSGASATPATQLHNYGKRKLDVNLSYRISPKLTLFADTINVLGDPLGGSPYVYIPGRKRGADKFSPEIKAGISGRF